MMGYDADHNFLLEGFLKISGKMEMQAHMYGNGVKLSPISGLL